MLNFIKKTRNEKGAAAVEFALLLPILVIIVFGIIYIGPLYYVWIELSHAARDGARLAAVGHKSSYIETQVKNMVPSIQSITIDPLIPEDRIVGEKVKITVTGVPLHVTIPFVYSGYKQLTATAEMRVEWNKPPTGE